ncbi:hypothetical protein [Octadecabacter antarcticus]|nr:hypothetical protein [Octadecabacter antarcticus]
MKRPIAISDSANFYVSAERIFDPTLKNVPVIVDLSRLRSGL